MDRQVYDIPACSVEIDIVDPVDRVKRHGADPRRG
jgi:hypothetical protein